MGSIHTGELIASDYGPAKPKGRTGRWIIFSLIVVVGLLLAMSILMPSLCRSRETANRVKCASNLRQIGQAIVLYTDKHAGAYPDSFETILMTEDITAECFVCPSSNDEMSTGPTTQAVAAGLGSGHHLSYLYAGRGLTTSTATADTVVAYEPLNNHEGDGMNILFGDGHVEFFNARSAGQIIPATTRPSTTQPK